MSKKIFSEADLRLISHCIDIAEYDYQADEKYVEPYKVKMQGDLQKLRTKIAAYRIGNDIEDRKKTKQPYNRPKNIGIIQELLSCSNKAVPE